MYCCFLYVGDIISTCRPFVRSSVRLFVCLFINHVNTVFWKRTNGFCCKLAQVVCWPRTWNGQLWGSGGQRLRFTWHGLEACRRHHPPLGRVVKEKSSAIPEAARVTKKSVIVIECLILTVSLNMTLCQFYLTNRLVNTWNSVLTRLDVSKAELTNSNMSKQYKKSGRRFRPTRYTPAGL